MISWYRFEYLALLLALTAITYILKARYKVTLFQNLKRALIFWAAMYFIGVPWDNYAAYKGHWLYPQENVLGIFIGYIPIEDYLFMFAVSFFSIVVYRVVEARR